MKKKEQVSLKPESEYRLSESNSLQPVTINPPPSFMINACMGVTTLHIRFFLTSLQTRVSLFQCKWQDRRKCRREQACCLCRFPAEQSKVREIPFHCKRVFSFAVCAHAAWLEFYFCWKSTFDKIPNRTWTVSFVLLALKCKSILHTQGQQVKCSLSKFLWPR